MIAIIMETYDNNKISHYVSSAIFTPVTFLVNDIEILTHQMECWCSEDGRIHWMFLYKTFNAHYVWPLYQLDCSDLNMFLWWIKPPHACKSYILVWGLWALIFNITTSHRKEFLV